MSNPKPESSGPPLRALAMVLIALAIVFAGLGLASLGGSGSQELGDSGAQETVGSVATSTVATSAAAATSAAVATSTAAAVPPVSTGAAASTSGTAVATTTPTATSTAGTAGVSLTGASKSASAAAVSVRVFNNSNITGLARETATKLTDSGWTVSETGNYSDGTIAKTTVYYGNSASEKEAATEIAAELGVSAEPRFAGIASSSPGVIVIVTSTE